MMQVSLDSALLHRIQELQQRCESHQQITHTDFFDAQTSAQLTIYLSAFSSISCIFSGGYPSAERQVLFFLPDWQPPDSFCPETWFSLLKIYPSSHGLTHRDYLGSLMSLGIDRKKIGDILVLPEGAELIVFPSIVSYLISNVTRIGRASAEIQELPFKELVIPQKNISKTTRAVSSFRCDSIIASAFGLSRSQAVSVITQGLVTINHLPESKPDRILPSECWIAIRGQGRLQIKRLPYSSRKGKILFEMIREIDCLA